MTSLMRALPLAVLAACALPAAPIKVLIIDGQNNHRWQETTPVLKRLLESTGKFQVDVATAPPKNSDISGFQPEFRNYKVVLLNYNGQDWPPATMAAFEKYVREGGGVVSYHAADNSFPNWKEYNRMTALGGWEARTTGKDGPYARFRDGKLVTVADPGRCGNHGARLPFQVTMRNPSHPISKGLPQVWMHEKDELYDRLCGPAQNMTLLATAHSDPNNRGTGEHEPMLFTVSYGKGRVFHTTLGHDVEAMRCVGFITTLQRGAQWAATGKVTIPVPKDFPTADKVSTRSE